MSQTSSRQKGNNFVATESRTDVQLSFQVAQHGKFVHLSRDSGALGFFSMPSHIFTYNSLPIAHENQDFFFLPVCTFVDVLRMKLPVNAFINEDEELGKRKTQTLQQAARNTFLGGAGASLKATFPLRDSTSRISLQKKVAVIFVVPCLS